ncbi:MAG: enoyl-CoA hydratase/isomerase family protein [Acidimicrobiia bacterium]
MDLPDLSTLAVELDGPVGRLWLDRPDKLNPLSTTTLEELVAAARWFDTHADIRVVVVGGRGRAFSAGADVTVFGGQGSGPRGEGAPSPRAAADAGRRMADAIEAMEAVTIARLHGHCVGGGVVLAAACDLRVAAVDTRFSIPEVDLGIPLAWGGIPRLVREIGPAPTKELVMTCRPFDAEEARSLGLVNRVVSLERLDAEVGELATDLAAKAAFPIQATKRHVDAVSSAMVGRDRAWSDADALVTALFDPECRAAAARYLERLR